MYFRDYWSIYVIKYIAQNIFYETSVRAQQRRQSVGGGGGLQLATPSLNLAQQDFEIIFLKLITYVVYRLFL